MKHRPIFFEVLALAVALACGKVRFESIEPAEPLPIPGRVIPSGASNLMIKELFPATAVSGVPFQVGKDGFSTIGVSGERFSPTSVIYFEDRPLATNYQSPRALAGVVPAELIGVPRRVPITVRDARRQSSGSEPVTFEILSLSARRGPPQIKELFPASATISVPFGLQPDGTWTIGVSGSGFGPNTVVLFDGVALVTSYQSPAALSAIVPPALVARSKNIQVSVVDPDIPTAKPSTVRFEVEP